MQSLGLEEHELGEVSAEDTLEGGAGEEGDGVLRNDGGLAGLSEVEEVVYPCAVFKSAHKILLNLDFFPV